MAQEQRISVVRPRLPRERESPGRERWLSADELRLLDSKLPLQWRPLFALLAFTGARIGEAQGLRWEDVRLSERRISLHQETRRLKNEGSVRMLPVPDELARVLASHAATVPVGPSDAVFAGALGNYTRALKAFRKACQAAGLTGVTPHDLRHTFCVHAIQNGVPLPRLQKLLGHATPAMVMRYAAHSPEAYLDADAAKVATALCGSTDGQAEGRAALARDGLRRA